MINLLPDVEKNDIDAARLNVILVKLIIFLSIAMIFLAIFCASTYLSLNSRKQAYENEIKAGETSSSTDDIGTVIANTQTIFSRQVSYSDLITDIGASFPNGASMSVLSLNQNIINQPFEVELKSTSNMMIPIITNNLIAKNLLTISSNPTKITQAADKSGYIIRYSLKRGNTGI
jgi:hypothetical protein